MWRKRIEETDDYLRFLSFRLEKLKERNIKIKQMNSITNKLSIQLQ